MPAATETIKKHKPYPWRCHRGGKWEVFPATFPYEAQIKYDGDLHSLSMPALEAARCRSCEEKVFSVNAGDQIDAALRSQLGLLQPEEIRSGRERLGLSTRHLADRIGVVESEVSDWEERIKIQARDVDRLLRSLLIARATTTNVKGTEETPRAGILTG